MVLGVIVTVGVGALVGYLVRRYNQGPSPQDDGLKDIPSTTTRVRDTRQTPSQVENTLQTPSGVENTRQTPYRIEDTRQTPSRREDTRETTSRVEDTQQTTSRIEDSQQTPSRVEDTRETPSQIEGTRQTPPRREDTRETTSRVEDTQQTTSRIEDTRQTPSQGEDTRKTPSRVEDTRNTPSRIENTRQTPSRIKDTRKTPFRVENTRQTPPRTEDTRQRPFWVEDTRQTPSRVDDTRKTSSRIENTRQTPSRIKDTRKTPFCVENTRQTPPRAEDTRQTLPWVEDTRQTPSRVKNTRQTPSWVNDTQQTRSRVEDTEQLLSRLRENRKAHELRATRPKYRSQLEKKGDDGNARHESGSTKQLESNAGLVRRRISELEENNKTKTDKGPGKHKKNLKINSDRTCRTNSSEEFLYNLSTCLEKRSYSDPDTHPSPTWARDTRPTQPRARDTQRLPSQSSDTRPKSRQRHTEHDEISKERSKSRVDNLDRDIKSIKEQKTETKKLDWRLDSDRTGVTIGSERCQSSRTRSDLRRRTTTSSSRRTRETSAQRLRPGKDNSPASSHQREHVSITKPGSPTYVQPEDNKEITQEFNASETHTSSKESQSSGYTEDVLQVRRRTDRSTLEKERKVSSPWSKVTSDYEPAMQVPPNSIGVWKFGENNFFTTVPNVWSVSDCIAHVRNRLGSHGYGELDLCNMNGNVILAKSKSLEDYPGLKKLHLVRRPRSRNPHPSYQTSLPDLTDPYDDDTRVLMSCQHAITPENLFSYVWSKITSGATDITCPAIPDMNRPAEQCCKIWDFKEVSLLACLSEDEMSLFTNIMFRNWMDKNKNVYICPQCNEALLSECPTNRCITCRYCSHTFCTRCSDRVNQFLMQCLNDECQQSLSKLRTLLQTCPVRNLVGVPNCPSVRACPLCQFVIEYGEEDSCKHMTCPRNTCQAKFCFICLKVKTDKYYWPCGGAFDQCTPAPRQAVE